MTDRCKHDLRLTACRHCQTPPAGISSIVYITAGGSHFHNSRECQMLISGQNRADSHGLNIHKITSVPWSDVFHLRDRCSHCTIE